MQSVLQLQLANNNLKVTFAIGILNILLESSLHTCVYVSMFYLLNIYLCFGCTGFQLQHMGSSLCHVGLSQLGTPLWCVGLVVAACGLSCSETCGILVPWPGIKPSSHALQGEFLTAGSPGKSLRSNFKAESLRTQRHQFQVLKAELFRQRNRI